MRPCSTHRRRGPNGLLLFLFLYMIGFRVYYGIYAFANHLFKDYESQEDEDMDEIELQIISGNKFEGITSSNIFIRICVSIR